MGNAKKILLVSFMLALASAATLAQGNDECSGATPITCGATESGSTSAATFDSVGFCGTANTAPGVWYRFVGDGSLVTASTCNSADYDTKISVFTGGCEGLTCVDGNDDSPGCSGFTTELTWCTEPGVEYFVLVHGFSDQTGNFDLSVSCEPVEVPNDDVCNALPLGTETIGFDNICATAQAGEATPPGGSGASSCDSQDGWCDFPAGVEPGVQNSVWYALEVPTSGSFSIETTGFDTQLSLWAARDCEDLTSGVATLVAANDDGGPFSGSLVGPRYCLSAGTNYWVQVDGWNGDQGEGAITVTELEDKAVTLCHAGAGQLSAGRVALESPVDSIGPVDIQRNLVRPLVRARDRRTINVNACAVDNHLDHGDFFGACPPACEQLDRVTLCHNADGKNPVTLEVSACAAPSHFAHGDNPGDCSLSALTLTLTTDDFANETSWVLADITDNVIIDSRGTGTLASATTFSDEYFVDSSHCFQFTIFDTFGDGICCSFGLGDYSLSLEAETVSSPSGGAFGSAETVRIGNCITDGSGTCASPFEVPPALPFSDIGNTCGSPAVVSGYQNATCNTVSYPGPELIYQIDLTTDNMIQVELTPNALSDMGLFMVADCTTPTSCVDFHDSIGPGISSSVPRLQSGPFTPGTYFIYVDSYYATGTLSCGDYTLDVTGTAGASPSLVSFTVK